MTADSFLNDTESQDAFKEAVADSLESSIDSSDVTITNVTENGRRARLRALTTSVLNVDYLITVKMEKLGFSDPAELVNAFTTTMTQAVSSGVFTSTLQAKSIEKGSHFLPIARHRQCKARGIK